METLLALFSLDTVIMCLFGVKAIIVVLPDTKARHLHGVLLLVMMLE
jgi:hypothetical protein